MTSENLLLAIVNEIKSKLDSPERTIKITIIAIEHINNRFIELRLDNFNGTPTMTIYIEDGQLVVLEGLKEVNRFDINAPFTEELTTIADRFLS